VNTSPKSCDWLSVFDDIFLGIDDEAIIRQVIGRIDRLGEHSPDAIKGQSWYDFVLRHADETAHWGLRSAWLAIAERQVAPTFWPVILPFRSGMTARLSPIETDSDSDISFAVQLCANNVYQRLAVLSSAPAVDLLARQVQISTQVFRGITGPLTDSQIKDIRRIVINTKNLKQLVDDIQAEIINPAVMAPVPQRLRDTLQLCEEDFQNRRIATHQLRIRCSLSTEIVYCLPVLLTVIHRIATQLFASITSESTIVLSDTVDSENQAIRLSIAYHTQNPALKADRRIDPVDLADPRRLADPHLVERLVTTARACLAPVNGHAWAEPWAVSGANSRFVLVLPLWQGPIPGKENRL
jgi:hypothetical protein